jgi:lactose/L-arabinose transport system permease protein
VLAAHRIGVAVASEHPVNPWTFDLDVNWRRLLIDRQFHAALGNTLLVLVIQVPLMLALVIVLALALNVPGLHGRALFRFAFFAPVVSKVAYLVVFRLLFNGQFGAVNRALESVGLRLSTDCTPADRLWRSL